MGVPGPSACKPARMRILLTAAAADRARDDIRDAASPAELAEMQDDGTLLVNGAKVEWDDADIDVAWTSFDLFADGPVRPFFGLLMRSNTLKWLQLSNAGVDHPVFADLFRRGLRLTTAHVTDIPIAEYVLRSVLDHYQRPDLWRAAQDLRSWDRHDFREVFGTTWLIVGVGAIGSAVARRAKGLGAHVTGVRRSPRGDEPVDTMISPADVHGALADADVVVISAPATAATQRLVDERFLGVMKDGSVLVNIARGSMLDESALLAALDRDGGIEAAILDVTDVEPLPAESPLWAHPAVTITPHNAAGGTGRGHRATELFCENLRRYRADLPLLHEVTEDDLP